ncbi:DUF1761 domain-containing protein [Virgibacillus sp. W0430]|uniref:DUF1761 domain-containing protein n=1 Tax=Virgibacillus sp. W0430 TaxID=3391580 RepID=UPI003F48769E
MIFEVSILPLIIGGIFNMVLGALWYSNVFFAKSWMKESGVTEEQVTDSSGMGKVYGLTLVMAVITSYVIGFIIVNFDITSIWRALIVAVILFLGVDLPMIIKNWGFERRSIKLGFINHGYQLVVYAVVGILFILL